ncbi:MAG TPA: hypothetical protein VFQ65_22375, partial [Kofleriaceae bacterium]|nr:hypothetical protein [Kofleriaceae bacterium]
MREFLWLLLAACGSTATPGTAPVAPSRSAKQKATAAAQSDVLDAITVLSADPDAYARSYVVPGLAS